jgi:hypothetical protein
MTTHIMSLTYAPKIEAVKAGHINQTIRLVRSSVEKKKGDKLILHTWEGKPYRSKWDWRLETRLTHAFKIKKENGIWYSSIEPENRILFNTIGPWCSQLDDSVDMLAYLDGIEPPTKDGLESTLLKLNGLKSLDGLEFQVIRWDNSVLLRNKMTWEITT